MKVIAGGRVAELAVRTINLASCSLMMNTARLLLTTGTDPRGPTLPPFCCRHTTSCHQSVKQTPLEHRFGLTLDPTYDLCLILIVDRNALI